MSTFSSLEVRKISEAEVEISAEVSAEHFTSYRPSAVKKLSQEVSIDGFRKGHIPEAVLVGKVGESVVLHEMAEAALSDVYPEILREKALKAIGAPKITLTKLAHGNPLGFKVEVTFLPEVALPDYREIAKKIASLPREPILVSDEETETILTDLRKNWGKTEARGARQETRDKRQGDEEKETEAPLPELTDAFAGKIGGFKTVAELRAKIAENLKEEKVARQKEKKRAALIDELLAKTPFPVPDMLVAAEKERMMAEVKGNITRMGVAPDENFLKLKKTEDEMKKEWGDTAQKKVRIQIILDEIGEKEKLVPEEKEVQAEAERIMKAFPGADRHRARSYVEGILGNEKVFEFFEEHGKSSTVE